MTVPYGISSFSEIRESESDYIDKTSAIGMILRSGANAYVFNRPRGFGKTLFLSTLNCYLNMEYRGNTWFDGLDVSVMHPHDPDKNAYPVIRLDLSVVRADSFEGFLSCFRDLVVPQMNGFSDLVCSDALNVLDRQDLARVFEPSADASMLSGSLRKICRYARKHYGKRVVILIDGLDSPVNQCGDKTEKREIVQFLAGFCGALKDNDDMRLGVIAGILPIWEDGMPSSINNIENDGVFDCILPNLFGFTENEVRALLQRNGLSDMYNDIRETYFGYRFGDSFVYSPVDIIGFVKHGKIYPYWAESKDDGMMDVLVSAEHISEELDTLTGGGSFECRLDTRAPMSRLHTNDDSLFGILVMTGYLKALPCGDGSWNVSVTNKTVLEKLKSAIRDRRCPRHFPRPG